MPARRIFLNGPSKGGKTTVSKAIETSLAGQYFVRSADSGAHFRRMTVALLDSYDVEHGEGLSARDIDIGLAKVIANDTAYEEDYAWGDLGRPGVEDLVSIVGRRAIAQESSMVWGAKVMDRADTDGVDALIINARTPRKWLRHHSPSNLAMELVVKCDPGVAGYRQALARGHHNPSRKIIDIETAKVIARREADASRTDHPYFDPSPVVPYTIGQNSYLTVVRARHNAPAGLPAPIEFDTTPMPFEAMKLAACGLATAALAYKS